MSVSLSASDEDCLAALAALYLPPDSSEDEETACWKAALRQQVEEVSCYCRAVVCSWSYADCRVRRTCSGRFG